MATRNRSKDDAIHNLIMEGYAEATAEQRHEWVRDGNLVGYEIVIVPGGGLWLKKEVGA